MTHSELEENLRSLMFRAAGGISDMGKDEVAEALSLFDSYLTQEVERAEDTVNRFEVINHLSDGKGREIVVWKGEPFKVEYSKQDGGRTLKVFLSDIWVTPPAQQEKK